VVDIENAVTIKKGCRSASIGFAGNAHRNFDHLYRG
jgi:hypothetical protein